MFDMMLEKSQESFLLAIEIYNKPTIKYRVEGFCFFICNAWELMLKAYLLKKGESIHYKDKKNINRTISLKECVLKIMTNEKDPLRINLETIIGMRNMANHLIIPEYAGLMNDVFMACTRNFTVKLKSYFDINISKKIPSNFLTMFIPSESSSVDIEGNYGKEIFKQYIGTKAFLSHSYSENSKNDIVNDSYAISYELTFKKANDISNADLTIAKAPNSAGEYGVIQIMTETNSKTHPLSCKQMIEKVNIEINNKQISITPISCTSKKCFTTNSFSSLARKYKFKEIADYTCKHIVGKTVTYSYSMKLVQKIIDIFTDDPDILLKIKKS